MKMCLDVMLMVRRGMGEGVGPMSRLEAGRTC